MLGYIVGTGVAGGTDVPQDCWGTIFSALRFPPNLQWPVEETAFR